MRRGKVLLGITTASVAVTVLLLGGVLSGSGAADLVVDPAAEAAPADQGALGALLTGFAAGDTAGLVRRLESRVADQPEDGEALVVLGLAYQQRARETGTSSYYGLSERALGQAALAGGPRPAILQGRAALANTRHRFGDGLQLARQAARLDSADGSAVGALGDALLELGRYQEAFRAYDRMAKLSPGITSYARIAHARKLLGRPEAAAEAYEIAIETGSPIPEHTAWARVQLGNVYFDSGKLVRAAAEYHKASRSLPGYVHAQAALARVDAAKGRYDRATRRLRRVVEALPVPAYVIQFGDTLTAAGRGSEARRQYALVRTLDRLLTASGVRTELQTALFDLDHDRNVSGALRRARLAFASSPGIYSEDAFAWGLYRVGRCGPAKAHSVHALRLGTKDAMLYFHRAMIEQCLGSSSARSWYERALATNPHFSLRFAPVAREALATSS